MRRFSSLKNNPTETRRILRDRFARYLPSDNTASIRTPRSVTLSDESLLQLLLNLTIDFASVVERAHAAYTAALPPNSGEPSLDELIETGWLHVIWGRISIPYEVTQAAHTATTGTMTAFAALLKKRHDETYCLKPVSCSDTALAAAATAIDKGELTPRDIGCQTPEWVAARLWDRTLKSFKDRSTALRVWFDRWQQLGYPLLMPGRMWDEDTANVFREAAFDVLGLDQSLTGWEKMRADLVKQTALVSKQPLEIVEANVPSVPTTLVERALWVEHTAMRRLNEYDDVASLVHLLLADAKAEDHAQAPDEVASRLIELAIDRADLFFIVLLQVRGNSVLLADLLLYPATSALACLLIAQWHSHPGAWDRELVDRGNKTTKTIAFADAASVMGCFIEQGKVDPKEAASLMDWFHKYAPIGFIDDLGNSESMLATLRAELARQSPEVLRTMVAALSASTPKSGLGTSNFAASLDIIDVGKLAGDIDPTPMVNAYVQSVAAGDYALRANRVGVSGAASLLKLASLAPPVLFQRFLCPVDISARFAANADEDPFTLAHTLARSIRAHIRVLSRAVVGWIETVPDGVVLALIASVRAGALEHHEKGRVAAFSPRYEANTLGDPPDRPIAADIGAALGALTADHREELLDAVLETDEPTVLAQLLAVIPHTMKERIRRRIAVLTPSEAGNIYSLTEAQARIESLLSADLGDAAERFMEVERELRTCGPVAGREVTHLRATLQLQLLRHEWSAIADTEPPSGLSHAEQQSATETITFYKALAALKNPNGNRLAAKRMFAQLQSRHPDVSAYVVNLFATRISLLLEDDIFDQLDGGTLVRGRQVLVEAEEMMLRVRVLSDLDKEIFNYNKALLLLALGQPEQANELLMSLHPTRLRDAVAAYTAVARNRLERGSEAIAILKQAEVMLGHTAVLRAARAHIEAGQTFAATTDVLSENDPVRCIEVALFNLKQMEHITQANVSQQSRSRDAFVIDRVRSAAASAISLVPMINPMEDDITALIRELLSACLESSAWSVSDQSKGGFTAKGNPGERDLILKKNGTEIAVIEAVVCRPPVSRQNLRQHFQRLFAYSTCNLFFHLTYSYVMNPDSILDKLREIATQDTPKGFTYIEHEDICQTDSRPVGFTASYRGVFDTVKVVFLVLDMEQHAQKQAAKIATT